MDFLEPFPKLLSPAVNAARAVLDDLSESEIPVSLRRVAASSADRLPPPLARSTLKELDRNEWLRSKVADQWHELDEAPPSDAAHATSLFLDRPEQWERQLGDLAAEAMHQDESEEVRRLSQEIERLKGEVDLARQKAKAAGRRTKQAERHADERLKASRAGVEQAKGEAQARSMDLQRRLIESKDERDAIAEERDRLAARLATTRAALLRRRRSRASTPNRGAGTWRFRDPEELARHLDQLVGATRSISTEEDQDRSVPETSLRLPAGIAPDEQAAFSWLTSHPDRLTLIVDGYNVTYQLDAARFHTPELRLRLNRGLADLRRAAKTPVKVVVVYDSDQGQDDPPAGSKAVDVRFTSPELLADEEILRLLPTLKGKVVVVSSDREVREGAESLGALGLWSEGLAAWIQAR